jgi:pyrimidine operon attenuation protein/uracil phosphoribosyltransferase
VDIPIVGIPRGGLLVALHLSYLSKRYQIESEDDLFFYRDPTTVIVVDDVLEKGVTREHWMKALQPQPDAEQNLNFKFAVLVDKSSCYDIAPADVSIIKMDHKEWIEFFYEKADSKQEKESMVKEGYGNEER